MNAIAKFVKFVVLLIAAAIMCVTCILISVSLAIAADDCTDAPDKEACLEARFDSK